MAWTTPVDQATGFLVTAAVYNSHIIDNLAYLHGDAGVIDVSAGSQFLAAAGLMLGVSAADTRLTRQAATLVRLADAAATGAGNFQLGGVSGSIGAGTVTPNAANFVTRWNVTAAGTVTIAAPTNPPSGNVTAAIVIFIHNSSGGAVTLAWNAAFTGAVISGPANGQGAYDLFVWNPGNSKWVSMVTGSVATGL